MDVEALTQLLQVTALHHGAFEAVFRPLTDGGSGTRRTWAPA
jgi:hypothetical protein